MLQRLCNNQRRKVSNLLFLVCVAGFTVVVVLVYPFYLLIPLVHGQRVCFLHNDKLSGFFVSRDFDDVIHCQYNI